MSKKKTGSGRIIFHIDMNCFYASVEMAYEPSLKGKPVAIAGNPKERKGIIVTSSYEARGKGVKTTMPVWQAKKLCPNLIILPPNFDRYRAASKEVFRILSEYTPYIEPVSIDEWYMDVTDANWPKGAVDLAKSIQKRLLNELDLPCSIGIAPNKFLAKMASDMKKPLGITVLRKRELHRTLWPLPVEKMHGVGNKTAQKLHAIGIRTIGDLAKHDVYELKHLFGINGERLKNRANGKDPRKVDPDAIYDFKSIGNSLTLPEDTTDSSILEKLLHDLCMKVEERMKRKEVAGMTIQVMIRYDNRQTITRSMKLQSYVYLKEDIFPLARDLFYKHWNKQPVRLLGVTVQDLEERQHIGEQLNLFTYKKAAQKEKLYETIEVLKEKYGENPFKKISDTEESKNLRTSFQKDFLDDYKQS